MDQRSDKNPSVFVLIDDDSIYNLVSTFIIRKSMGKGIPIESFINASDGIRYISEQKNAKRIVLFLDINMPVLDGWGTLELLGGLDAKIIKTLEVYIVTSSINPADSKRALSHKLVKGFVEKPISVEKMESLFETNNSDSFFN